MPRGSRPGERRGGRQKGTPNKTTAELRAAIIKADPIGFMVEVMRGEKKFKQTAIDKDGKPRDTEVRPTVDQRQYAAKFLGERIVPAMKSVEFKDDDGTIKTAFAAALAAMTKK